MNKFYIEKYDFQDTASIEQKFQQLLDESINSADELEYWLHKQFDFLDTIEEALNGHFIDFQCHSNNEKSKETLEHDQQIIEPILKRYQALLDKKFYDSPHRTGLNPEYYEAFIKSKKNSIELFSETNVELEVEEDRPVAKYFELTGNLTVDWNGEQKTISQLQVYLEDSNREIRKKAMSLMYNSFSSIENELQDIMSQLIQIRQKKADNVGLSNYRDYMFKKYERFDYTPSDCKELAEAIKKHVIPVKKKLQKEHQQKLNVSDYRLWDTRAVPKGEKPLKPFEDVNELIAGTTEIFNLLDPKFGKLLKNMDENGVLDLENRKGKAPGGFCEFLPVSKSSYIFLNITKTHVDMIGLVHEMGHCIHDDLKKDFSLSKYRDTPMESSELASETMELITMDHWDVFYKNKADFNRAKKDLLKFIIESMPSAVIIDQFQHWMYETPNHSGEDRKQKFKQLTAWYDADLVNGEGCENWSEIQWLPVLHIFEVPFYYIEYIISQFGAIQMYKQYKENPDKALANYKKALSLGSSKSLPEVYEAAGIRFDFSEELVKESMTFLEKELELL